jgi:hypothetical protein
MSDFLTTTYGQKHNGELLSSETWNGLVAALADISAKLSARIDTLDASIKTVADSLTALGTKVDSVKSKTDTTADRVTFLYDLNYRLTLRTEGSRYAVGSPAVIMAQLTDLTGADLSFADASTRPWVDFITTWGKFSPATGYEGASRGGVGDRSMSVQVDAGGLAKVHLIAEQIEDLSTEDQTQLTQVLAGKAGALNKSIADCILDAPTPAEVRTAGVFGIISNHYDTRTGGVRNFADLYYLKNSVRLTNRVDLIRPQSWKDYLSTIVAFVKQDIDPTTADTSKGASSTQVVFRDWTHAWINQGYFSDILDTKTSFHDRVVAKVGADSAVSSRLIKDEVASFVQDAGVLGRQRNFKAMREVFNTFSVPNPPAYVPALALAMRDAVSLQQSLDLSAAMAGGDGGLPIVFDTMTGTSVDAHAAADAVKSALEEKLSEIDRKVADTTSKMNRIDGDFAVVKGRIDTHEGQFTEMSNLNAKISNVQNQVKALNDFKVLDVPIDIDTIKKDVTALKLRMDQNK